MNPAPTPNVAARISFHGLTGFTANPRKPDSRISTIPHTRWCRCRPDSVVTLPGHHGTRGLRISRALVRMNRNEQQERSQQHEPGAGSGLIQERVGQLVLEYQADGHADNHAA